MIILTDIGHPKNVHILKNLVPLLREKGHAVHFVIRDKEDTRELCRAYGIAGYDRGEGAAGVLGKLFYLLRADIRLLKLAGKLKPNLLLSFASPYLASLARIKKLPMIVFDDTEKNWLVQRIYAPAAAAIVVPSCFQKKLSSRQKDFPGYYELAYLAPRYFQPDRSILKELGVASGEKYVVLRFVSWQAVHDINKQGLNGREKEELVRVLSGLARVFLSAEGDLPEVLAPLRLKTPPERIHQVMAHAELVFSEGATMAAEAAVLGVPTVHCSDLRPGYIEDLEQRFGLLRSFSRNSFQDALAHCREALQNGAAYREELEIKRQSMLAQSVDVVQTMLDLIDQFASGAIIR